MQELSDKLIEEEYTRMFKEAAARIREKNLPDNCWPPEDMQHKLDKIQSRMDSNIGTYKK